MAADWNSQCHHCIYVGSAGNRTVAVMKRHLSILGKIPSRASVTFHLPFLRTLKREEWGKQKETKLREKLSHFPSIDQLLADIILNHKFLSCLFQSLNLSIDLSQIRAPKTLFDHRSHRVGFQLLSLPPSNQFISFFPGKLGRLIQNITKP